MPEKTEWFDSNTKPVNIGWYERKTTEATGYQEKETCFSWWNGEYFEDACPIADNSWGFKSAEQNTPWRGLTHA